MFPAIMFIAICALMIKQPTGLMTRVPLGLFSLLCDRCHSRTCRYSNPPCPVLTPFPTETYWNIVPTSRHIRVLYSWAWFPDYFSTFCFFTHCAQLLQRFYTRVCNIILHNLEVTGIILECSISSFFRENMCFSCCCIAAQIIIFFTNRWILLRC